MWIMETDEGLVVVTGEWFEPEGMEPAQALADEILDSFVIGSERPAQGGGPAPARRLSSSRIRSVDG